MSQRFSRRDWLKMAAGTAAGGALAGAGLAGALTLGASGATAAANPARKRTLRMAFVTDAHIKTTKNSLEGAEACIAHVNALKDPVDLVIQGGDFIMDALDFPRDKTKEQFDAATKIFSELRAPVEHIIGNHDIWGWGSPKKSGTTGAEPEFGKAWAMDVMKLESPYRTFERGGWMFVVLDTVFRRPGGGYLARIGQPQAEWLDGVLAAEAPRGTPICVVSHIPIFSLGATLFSKSSEVSGQWRTLAPLMLNDARAVKDIFWQYPNVKLCVAGHIHLADRIDYNGVTYIGSGAVSGNWWGGMFQETPESYTVVNFYDDGTTEHEAVIYRPQVSKRA